MELFYSSGLRLAELVGLDSTDLDLADRTVRVLGKGTKTRIVPVGTQAVDGDHAPGSRERAALAEVGEPALFVGQNGRRLGARAIQRRIALLGAAQGLAVHVSSAPVPSFLRDAPAGIEPGPARRAGTARARRTSLRRRSTRTLISSTWPASTTHPTRGQTQGASQLIP